MEGMSVVLWIVLISIVVVGVVSILLGLLWFLIPKAPSFNLTGRHVMITGGSSGIGRAAAIQFAEEGEVEVITLVARNMDRLNSTKSEIQEIWNKNGKQGGKQVFVMSLDVSSKFDDINEAFEDHMKENGNVDVLICSAGNAVPLRFEDLTLEHYHHQMNLNFFGTVYCIKAIVPSMMKSNRGRIVLVSSMVGMIGMFGYCAYAPSKFALRGFAESLHQELVPYSNVFISVSYPPDTETPGLEQENKTKPEECKLLSQSGKVHPPESVAKDIILAIRNWKFNITHDLDGKLISFICQGIAPVSSLAELLMTVLLAPFIKMFAVFLGWQWRGIITSTRLKQR